MIMRVLLCDSVDNSLVALEVDEVNYDPDDRTVCISTVHGWYELYNMTKNLADNIITTLYNEGKIDITEYKAVFMGQ